MLTGIQDSPIKSLSFGPTGTPVVETKLACGPTGTPVIETKLQASSFFNSTLKATSKGAAKSAAPVETKRIYLPDEGKQDIAARKICDFIKMRLKLQKSPKSTEVKAKAVPIQSLIQSSPLTEAMQRVKAAKLVGQEQRERIVLPSQLKYTLQDYFSEDLSVDQCENLAKMICREIKDLNEDQSSVNSRYLKSQENAYLFPIFNEDNKQVLTEVLDRVCDCWLERSADGKTFSVLLIDYNEKEPLGSGKHKAVYKAHYLQIGLAAQPGKIFIATRPVSIEPQVFLRAKKEREYAKAVIRESMEIQQEVLTLLPEAEKCLLQSLPVELAQADAKAAGLDMRQKWYNGDLDQAMRLQRLPLSIHQSSAYAALGFRHWFQALVDVASVLEKMHAAGLVHGDVKPSNILLEIKENKQSSSMPAKVDLRGIAADFDIADTVRFVEEQGKSFMYWDQSRKNGLISPFSDCYALTICALEVMFMKGEGVLKAVIPLILQKPAHQKILESDLQELVLKTGLRKALGLVGVEQAYNELTVIDAQGYKNPQETLNLVDKFLICHERCLSEEVRQRLKQLRNENRAATMVFQLFMKGMNRNFEIFNYFIRLQTADPATFETLCRTLPEETDAATKAALNTQKLAIIQKCSKACGDYSMSQIKSDLQAILHMLDGSKAENKS